MNSSTTTDTLPLTGKNVLIGGLVSDFAVDIAMRMINDGATVILLDERPLLSDFMAKLSNEQKLRCLIIPFDFAYDSEVPYQKLKLRLQEQDIDQLHQVLVFNRHYAPQLGITEIIDFPAGLWQQVMQNNLNGPFLLVRVLLPLLMRSSNSSLVLSALDEKGLMRTDDLAKGVAGYAMNGLVKLLAQELAASHVTVCGMSFNRKKQRDDSLDDFSERLKTMLLSRSRRNHGQNLII